MEQTASDEALADRDRTIMDHLAALRSLAWRQAMVMKDGRNQVALLEREMTRSRSSFEQFLAVTLSKLDETGAALRAAEAERTALSERLGLMVDRNRRLTTRMAAMGTGFRSNAADAETLSQIRGLSDRIGEIEAALKAALQREETLRFERTHSRWIRLGRVLRLTKL